LLHQVWKRGTVRTLVLRAFKVCSTDQLRYAELKHLESVLTDLNGYPYWVVDGIIREISQKRTNQNDSDEH